MALPGGALGGGGFTPPPAGAILPRFRHAAALLQATWRQHGLMAAAGYGFSTALRKGTLLLRQVGAGMRERELRQALREERQRTPGGVPRIAVAITGGIGDFLVIGRFLRDLEAHAGGAGFDIFCPRPALAAWALGGLPGLRQVHYDILFDGLRREYDVALRANQMVVLYQEDLRWAAVRDNPALAEAVATLIRNRPVIDPFVAQHPWHDNFLAQKAVFGGRSRRDFLHHLAGLEYRGDRMAVPQEAAALRRFGLSPGGYVTVHNGFDTEFIIAGRRATKCYPHFDAVVAQVKAARPDLAVIQLGTATSTPIPSCDQVLIGRTSMPEVAAILAGSQLHLDNEGGLVHLAASLGTRSAVLFGPTPVDYFGYPQNLNIAPPVCGGCWWMTRTWMDSCAKGYATALCLQHQAPEGVAAQVLAALAPVAEVAA
ncbi:glycosyltransferase family 9 protein [Siccirubricoccus phaeus]|uniref:glycosyltransferase family 9 protein n=1 Tax=Siccirubricoccus phaeus TaxID=2595053 RepID=UPI00165C36AC|nr:glycosyltransferase family 9 protein [Siccirubricoccus phaeus]